MGFIVIPAVDIKGGKCVRLRQGRMQDETVFSQDPVAMAQRWVQAGARRLHIVDLDGAHAGEPVNAPIIEAIANHFPELPIQVGGGVRDKETIRTYLNAGVRYVILGTQAVAAPHFVSEACAEFRGHVIVGLDAKAGRVATDGWARVSGLEVVDFARRFQNDGVEAFVYTDISRDGMMAGVNVEATQRLARSVSVPVIASGGISSLQDIRRLCAAAEPGIVGAITGRAIYEGSLDLTEAQQLADELTGENH
jgi:phosphoribosylformimino-5-aminoimidazole carboxamide ribotide isomerase